MDRDEFDVIYKNKAFSDNYIEEINNQTWSHGLYIEVDEAATKKFEAENAKLSESIKERKETERAMNAEKIANAAAASLGAFVEAKPKQRRTRKQKVENADNKS